MELRHLRYFLAVADLGTTSRAAEHLNTSQPSLSRQIHDLEDRLGVALFERVGRRLRLTGAGADLAGYARAVLNDAEGLEERARSLNRGEAGVLRVGATPQTIERLFPALLTRFIAHYDQVDVRLTEGTSSHLVGCLREGELDLAITVYQAEWRASARDLGTVPLLAIAASGADSGSISRAELQSLEGRPLLVLHPGYGSRDYLDAACAVARVHPDIVFESSAPATLIALARAGRGTAVIPGTVAPVGGGVSAQALVHDGDLLELRLAVHWNPHRFLPTYARRFMDELEAVAREVYAQAPAGWGPRLARAPGEPDGRRAPR